MNIQNLNFTVEELKILAENGQKDFIYAVGHYYENGIRTSVNLTEAAVWYEKAAQKGHTEAAMHLALLYAQGAGVEKNEKKAFSYMEQAAKAGNTNALYNMGRCYEEGIGVNRIFQKLLTGTKRLLLKAIFVLCAVWPDISYRKTLFI